MKIVITDSGLGGLSVCGYFANILQKHSSYTKQFENKNSTQTTESIQIIYVNAVPSDDRGYNSMSGIDEQKDTFNKVLQNIHRIYSPDLIFVACGSLSVLLPEMEFVKAGIVPVKGNIEVGVSYLLSVLKKNKNSPVIIFATPTTIDQNTFQQALIHNGIAENSIINQACPDLATQISNDTNGNVVNKLIQYWTKLALQQLPEKQESTLVAFLGCTHYGYRQKYFLESLNSEYDQEVELINPNRSAADYIFHWLSECAKFNSMNTFNLKIEFVTPYKIPPQEQKTLPQLLKPISEATAQAFLNPTISPDLSQ